MFERSRAQLLSLYESEGREALFFVSAILHGLAAVVITDDVSRTLFAAYGRAY
jgi:hypothetical protein